MAAAPRPHFLLPHRATPEKLARRSKKPSSWTRIITKPSMTFLIIICKRPDFWAADWTLHYAVDQHMFEELSDFANLPLLALVSVVLSFVFMPALNAYSRFNERQADRYAFESISSVDPFITSMNKLAEQNLAERTPSRWVEWFFHSHPAISRRLAAAKAWTQKHNMSPQA